MLSVYFYKNQVHFERGCIQIVVFFIIMRYKFPLSPTCVVFLLRV
jgi:hypothetical protein